MTVQELWKQSGITRAAAIHAAEQMEAGAIENWESSTADWKTYAALVIGQMTVAAEENLNAVLGPPELRIATNFAVMGMQRFLLLIDEREQEK